MEVLHDTVSRAASRDHHGCCGSRLPRLQRGVSATIPGWSSWPSRPPRSPASTAGATRPNWRVRGTRTASPSCSRTNSRRLIQRGARRRGGVRVQRRRARARDAPGLPRPGGGSRLHPARAPRVLWSALDVPVISVCAVAHRGRQEPDLPVRRRPAGTPKDCGRSSSGIRCPTVTW